MYGSTVLSFTRTATQSKFSKYAIGIIKSSIQKKCFFQWKHVLKILSNMTKELNKFLIYVLTLVLGIMLPARNKMRHVKPLLLYILILNVN